MRLIIPQLIFFILFWLLFFSFQNEKIYNHSLGLISHNYIATENGSHQDASIPYIKVTNENVVKFDSGIYHTIKKTGYDVQKSGGDYVFGFFPLYPMIWKLSMLPSVAMIFLNFAFYIVAVILIGSIFKGNENGINSWCLAIFPGIIVFLIPYSEATFLLFISLGFYGLVRKNYLLFFIGFMLGSMTRTIAPILLISIFITELLFCFKHGNIKNRVKSFFMKVLPVISGIVMVIIIQGFYDSGNPFKFAEVQQNYWSHTFSIPVSVTDWSWEGFGMNMASFLIIGIPVLVLAVVLFFRNRFENRPEIYLQLLSMVFLTGTCLYIYFYQHGSFNSAFRYLFCSPFFVYLLFSLNVSKIRVLFRVIGFVVVITSAIYIMKTVGYSAGFNFSDLGFIVTFAALSAWLFSDFHKYRLYWIFIGLFIFTTAVWTTFLFNCYISGAINFL